MSVLKHLLLPLAATLITLAPAWSAEDFSPAERALFMTNQLAGTKPPASLNYKYVKSGSLEEGFSDTVVLKLTAQADGRCCAASSQFLTGSRAMSMPEIEAAEGNPALLYFLERDIREMNRLTKGQSNYFRKRIRMAVYQGATIQDVSLPYMGKSVAGKRIVITPYLDDPLRDRFKNLYNKTYVFALSDAVPGGIYGVRSQIDPPEADKGAPLMVEEMILDGGSTLAAAGKP